jgi:hypothetical protein
MKKIVILMLVMLLGLSVTILGVEDENDPDIVKLPFKSFSLIFTPDKENPDLLRDGLPWAEYNPEIGWTLYKVEVYKGEETIYNTSSWFRLKLNKNNEPIPLNPSDGNFSVEFRRCFSTNHPKTHIEGELDQEYLEMSIFFASVDIPEGELCGRGLVYRKQVNTDHKHLSLTFLTGRLEKYGAKEGDIDCIDSTLQFEKWRVNGNEYGLEERCAINPETLSNDDHYYSSGGTARFTNINVGYLELFPDKNKIIYKGNEYEYHRYPRFPHCEMYDDNIAINIYTLGEILGCNVHSWDFETRKSHFDTVHMDYYYINLMDEDDSFRRLTFEFDNKTANLHRPIYDDKTVELPFAPYLNKERKKYKTYDPIEMMVPLITILDTLELDYYYRPMNNSVLISLDKDW